MFLQTIYLLFCCVILPHAQRRSRVELAVIVSLTDDET